MIQSPKRIEARICNHNEMKKKKSTKEADCIYWKSANVIERRTRVLILFTRISVRNAIRQQILYLHVH